MIPLTDTAKNRNDMDSMKSHWIYKEDTKSSLSLLKAAIETCKHTVPHKKISAAIYYEIFGNKKMKGIILPCLLRFLNTCVFLYTVELHKTLVL